MSLWSWVNRPQELERLTNPLYESNSLVIWPSVAPQSLLLWEGKRNETHLSLSLYEKWKQYIYSALKLLLLSAQQKIAASL